MKLNNNMLKENTWIKMKYKSQVKGEEYPST